MGKMYFTKEHEWILVDGDEAQIGITPYAVKALGQIVFVELPVVDTIVDKGDSFAVVESVKAASDIYMPIYGKVIRVNEELEDAPQLLNEEEYVPIAVIEDFEEVELDELMNESEYEEYVATLK